MAFDKAPAGMGDSRAWPTALARAIADQLQGALDLCAYRGAGTVARAPIAAGARHYSSFQSAPRLGRPDLVRMRPPADPRRTLTLEPGSLLCLLTDGLIDHDNRDIYTGLTTVRTVLAHSVTADSPYGLAESACAALMTTLIGDRHVDDDVTILAIGREACRGNPTTQPETSRSSTPGDLSSLVS